jgi:hypothetical protein
MKTSCAVIFHFGVFAACLAAGCSSKPIPPNPRDGSEGINEVQPTDSVFVLEPSFACLSEPLSKTNGIPWQVALTLAEISKMTYDEGNHQISSIKKLGAKVVQPIAKGLSHGTVASNDKAVVIGFRGTNVAADWLTNSEIIGLHVGDGKIHRGFFRVVDAIYKEVFDEAIRQGAKNKIVWITGHSLGGAMAMVFAHRGTTENQLAPEGIVTFGQPLAVSGSLAQFFLDTFNTRYIRFVNSWDAVPRLLPNYRHAGSRVYMKEGSYVFRKPMMAFSAAGPPDEPIAAENPASEAPTYVFVENEKELEPMSQEQFVEFQDQLRIENAPPAVGVAGAGPVGAFSIPWYEAHLMSLYIERIKEFGEKDHRLKVSK